MHETHKDKTYTLGRKYPEREAGGGLNQKIKELVSDVKNLLMGMGNDPAICSTTSLHHVQRTRGSEHHW